jgi:hypothetical protein
MFALTCGALGACRNDAPSVEAKPASVSRALASTAGPPFVDVTWMSIANVYYELGSLGVMTDGYFTRLPQSEFFGGGGGLAHTHDPLTPDVAAVHRVLDALGGPSAIDLLLTGHSHFDHSFDTATWSSLTGAPIYGPKTTCFQTAAQNLPPNRCTPVFGAERLTLSDGVTVRVVRWNHSGDSTSDPEQHNPVELEAPPTPDPVTGGLHAGVADDFPNGGGGRGFLFVVDGPTCRYSWFYENSASAADLTVATVVDGVNYGAPLDNLKAALSDAGLTSVDLWIGSADTSVAQLVVPVLKPKAYLPVHWDGLWRPFLSGAPSAFSDAALESFLSASSVGLVRPTQYMDKWRLDCDGIVPVGNGIVKQALGFCTPVTSCPTGTNCGTIPNACGATVACGGACAAPQTCGGGGTANVCGCAPLTTCPSSTACGAVSDGCGGVLTCTCPSGALCAQGRCVLPDAAAEQDVGAPDGITESAEDHALAEEGGASDIGASTDGDGEARDADGPSDGAGAAGDERAAAAGDEQSNDAGKLAAPAARGGGGDEGTAIATGDVNGASPTIGGTLKSASAGGTGATAAGCGCRVVPDSSGVPGLTLAIAILAAAFRRRGRGRRQTRPTVL